MEWARSLARAERWEEEVVLIPIEMRRVLRGLVWKARWWKDTALTAPARSLRGSAGIKGYAAKQADILEGRAHEFASLWLTLFDEHDLPTPSGWPHSCNDILTREHHVVRRRHRQKLFVSARAPPNSNQPQLEIEAGGARTNPPP